MPAPRALVRLGLFPLHERLRGRRTSRMVTEMLRRDRWSPGQMQAFHDQMLVEHLRRAATDVPYYRERVRASEIQAPSDLARFPTLDKPMIRAAGDALRSTTFSGRWIRSETGGSSGEPLRFWTENVREASQLACKWRARSWFGLDLGSRETDLWGSPIETGKQSFLRRTISGLLGFQLLSAFNLNETTLASYRARLEGGRADFLYGYASVLARYARYLEGKGETLRDLGLKVAIATAEVLLPEDRIVIERVFGCPVANEYGCRDGALIAHDCERGGFHLMHDAVHVEVLDEHGHAAADGERGEVVVTNLWAVGYPLIRYRLGDLAVRSTKSCPCNRPHPCLERVEGRQTDSVVKSNGTRVHGLALIYVLRELPGVDRFRCVQERASALSVEVVPAAGFDEGRVQTGIVDRVRRILGADTEVTVKLVPSLEQLPSGKHRFIICRVPDPSRNDTGSKT